MSKFTHTKTMDDLKTRQSQEIVPLVDRLMAPKSVIDVGCGTASLLHAFKESGVKVTGIDGKWVNRGLLLQNIAQEEFIERDLELPLSDLKLKADLAICLEVAEHLSEKRANSLVHDLVNMSDAVLFSAAIPKQGGQNHINEQWLPYWEEKFKKHGYVCHDILKDLIWNNEHILWWYKQNMVVFAKEGFEFKMKDLKHNSIKKVVHPELFRMHVDYTEKNAVKRHAKILMKSILFKMGLMK